MWTPSTVTQESSSQDTVVLTMMLFLAHLFLETKESHDSGEVTCRKWTNRTAEINHVIVLSLQCYK